MLDATALDAVRASVQGGIVGGLSWGALLILSTAVADVWRRGRTRAMLLCCAALWLVALLTVVLVPVSKTRVSLSYMLVSLAIGALGFLLVDLLSRVLPARAGFFAWWGENALLLYLLHLPLLGLVEFAGGTGWYAGAPLWLIAVQLIAILGVLSAAAWWLHRRGIRLGL
jgi:fucose 4-O-acetylase-like acetyltransferase